MHYWPPSQPNEPPHTGLQVGANAVVTWIAVTVVILSVPMTLLWILFLATTVGIAKLLVTVLGVAIVLCAAQARESFAKPPQGE